MSAYRMPHNIRQPDYTICRNMSYSGSGWIDEPYNDFMLRVTKEIRAFDKTPIEVDFGTLEVNFWFDVKG